MNGVATKHANGLNGGALAGIKSAALRGESGLAKIEVQDDNPFVMFRDWFDAAKASHLVLPQALCLSTASKDGRVSARHVILRRLEDDGFVVMTDRRSRKSAELAENPYAAMTFLWCYKQADGVTINRQVRIEGDVAEVTADQVGDIYDREPLYCKIRTHICHQGTEVNWDAHKKQHDEMIKKVAEEGETLPCPDHFIAYKLTPKMIEFYYAHDSYIGDRIMFLKNSADKWEHKRIAA